MLYLIPSANLYPIVWPDTKKANFKIKKIKKNHVIVMNGNKLPDILMEEKKN